MDFEQFHVESYLIAREAYTNLTSSSTTVVPDEYIAHFEPIAKRRVVLAAHRMAYMIEIVFGTEWNEEKI